MSKEKRLNLSRIWWQVNGTMGSRHPRVISVYKPDFLVFLPCDLRVSQDLVGHQRDKCLWQYSGCSWSGAHNICNCIQLSQNLVSHVKHIPRTSLSSPSAISSALHSWDLQIVCRAWLLSVSVSMTLYLVWEMVIKQWKQSTPPLCSTLRSWLWGKQMTCNLM